MADNTTSINGALKFGHTYDLYYPKQSTIADPYPHLYVFMSDKNFTYGLNLHYLLTLRGTHSKAIEGGFRRISYAQWQEYFEKVKELGTYDKFFDVLNKLSERELNKSEYERIATILTHKFPIPMQTYRVYETRPLRIIKHHGRGVL